jgi:hypothetical protein
LCPFSAQQEDIKAQADGMLNQDSVHLLLKSFKDYVDLHCNPDACLDALFTQVRSFFLLCFYPRLGRLMT